MPLPDADSQVFEHKVGGGWLALFGAPFAFAGLAILLGPFFDTSDGMPIGSRLLVGSIFTVLGSSFIFGRYHIRIDKDAHQVTRQWSLITPLHRKVQSLNGLRAVRIDHEIRKSKNSSYSVYPTRLIFEDKDNLTMESPRSPLKARQLGETLARFLRVALTDASQGAVTTRQADELDLNLRQRVRSGRLEAEIPIPPHRLVSQIEYDGHRLKVEIPPPGPKLKLLAAIVPVLAFIGFAAFVFVGPILGERESIPLPMLLFMVVFFTIPGSIVLTLLGRMLLFRQTLLADSAIVSHSRGWLVRKTTTLPCDRVEEILAARPSSKAGRSTLSNGPAILIHSDEKSIRINHHLPPQESDYILSLLRAVIAS